MNKYKQRAMKRLFGDAIINDATTEEIQSVPNRTQILQLIDVIEGRVGISKYFPESKTFYKYLDDIRRNYLKAENLQDCKQLLNKLISISKKPEFYLMIEGSVAETNSHEHGAQVVKLALNKIKNLMK